MENKQITEIDLLVETHIGLLRQGPGSPETIMKALRFIENSAEIARVADLGCGTGGQTMELARQIGGNITGVDVFPAFINVFNTNAQKQKFSERVKGIVGSMDNLSFQKEEFDLIWAEGAIDNIGFENGLRYWYDFLKKDGYVAVSCPSWFTKERIAEVEQFWADAGSVLDTVSGNIKAMQKIGYRFVAAFALPEKDWIDNYFTPRTEVESMLSKKYAGNKMVEDSIASSKYEVDLYLKHKQYYGYVFYIGRKV